MTDKYDDAIAYLTAHPEEIGRAWSRTETHLAGCLFACCKADEPDDMCGCLTEVKAGILAAQTESLTLAILADERIPSSPEDITISLLPVFAAWQRRIDVALERKV